MISLYYITLVSLPAQGGKGGGAEGASCNMVGAKTGVATHVNETESHAHI